MARRLRRLSKLPPNCPSQKPPSQEPARVLLLDRTDNQPANRPDTHRRAARLCWPAGPYSGSKPLSGQSGARCRRQSLFSTNPDVAALSAQARCSTPPSPGSGDRCVVFDGIGTTVLIAESVPLHKSWLKALTIRALTRYSSPVHERPGFDLVAMMQSDSACPLRVPRTHADLP